MSRKQDNASGLTGVKGIPPGYEVVHRCGEGTFGQVYLCRSATGSHVAIKTIKQEGSKQESEGIPVAAIREASLLRELSHPNILKLESVYVNNTVSEFALSLVFEFVDHDLHEMMQVQKGYANRLKQLPMEYFPSNMVCSIMFQVLQGLFYLHKNWVIHRDMKPSNLLVSGIDAPNPGRVRIADFGLARVYRSPPRPLVENGVVVTIWYRAPELLLGTSHYTPAVDMWAAGCILGELLTLTALFPGSEVREPLDAFQYDQLHKIMAIMGPLSADAWPGIVETAHWKRNTQHIQQPARDYRECLEDHLLRCNPNLVHDQSFKHAVDLLKQLLHYHPGKRLTAEEALHHPYFKRQPPPSMNCYPPGYKPRYNSKSAKEQQKKKPVAAVPAVAAAATNSNTAVPRNQVSGTGIRAGGGGGQPSRGSRAASAVRKVDKKSSGVKKTKARSDK